MKKRLLLLSSPVSLSFTVLSTEPRVSVQLKERPVFFTDCEATTTTSSGKLPLGSTGKTALPVYLHNYSTSPTATSFKAAFDNFKVVKR